jgi:hypothetical protein
MGYLKKQISEGRACVVNGSSETYQNDAVLGFWNSWEARDSRTRKERTFTNGRFSREKPGGFLGIGGGNWYCCLTKDAALASGMKLDPV